MNFPPIMNAPRFLCFIFIALAFILACDKDNDQPYELVDETVASEKVDARAVNNPIEANISGFIPSSAKAPVKVDFKAWNSKNQKDITN